MIGIPWKMFFKVLLHDLKAMYGGQRVTGTFAVVLALSVLFASPVLRELVSPSTVLEPSELLTFQDSDAFRLTTEGLTRMTALACEPVTIAGPVSLVANSATPGSNPKPGCDTPYTIVGATLPAGDYQVIGGLPEIHLFSDRWTWVDREFSLIPRLQMSVGALLMILLSSVLLVTIYHVLFR